MLTTSREGLDEIRERLGRFAQAHIGPEARIAGLEPGPGHAGFSYLFDVNSRAGLSRYYLRLPPSGVKWEGPADMKRHVTALRALEGTAVPHAPLVWDGDDLSWFGAPYYIVGRIDGVTLADQDTITSFSPDALRAAARRAMTALADIHTIDHTRRCAYLGTFRGLREDVLHWERFEARAADRDKLLPLFPRVRDLLLSSMPADFTVGLYHGDFQFQNLMYAPDGTLLAVIDWELCGIGPTLNDLGWIVAFHDRPAWGPVPRPSTAFADAADLTGYYVDALGHEPAHVDWFEALSLYKYAAISGFNLMLHRRGKRVDPVWEERAPGVPCNLEHALRLLGG